MAANEAYRFERTWLCSVLFTDIVNYSSQSVQLQMKWKEVLRSALFEALKSVPADDRVLIDTGDGASVCFLGDPEVALLSTLSLRSAFISGTAEDTSCPRVRLGINLGPVKLVRDINGNPNAIGDGINVAQRIMSFADPNQILVSRSYFEVISRLSDDYQRLFRNLGVRQDKHVREHVVYELTPPGTPSPTTRETDEPKPQVSTNGAQPIAGSSSRKLSRTTVIVTTCIALIGGCALSLIIWHRSSAKQQVSVLRPQNNQVQPVPIPKSGSSKTEPLQNNPPQSSPASRAAKPAVSKTSQEAPPAAVPPHSRDADATLVQDEMAQNSSPGQKLAESIEAQELINLHEYDKAIALLNRAIAGHANVFDLYLELGEAYQKQHQFENAIQAYTQSIRLRPTSATALLERGNCLSALREDEQALTDYNAALDLRPNSAPALNGRGVFFMHRGKYNEAISDFSEAMRASPNYYVAYLNRSRARRAIGDVQGANEDEQKASELGANRDPISPGGTNFAGTWEENDPKDPLRPMRLLVRQNGNMITVQISYTRNFAGRAIQASLKQDEALWIEPQGCASQFRKPGYNYDSPGLNTFRLTLQATTLTYKQQSQWSVPCDGHPSGTETVTKQLRRIVQ